MLLSEKIGWHDLLPCGPHHFHKAPQVLFRILGWEYAANKHSNTSRFMGGLDSKKEKEGKKEKVE